MEAIKKDYESKGVKFYFIYKSLAHPEGGTQSYVAPFSLKERVAHIELAYKELGNTIPWLCDNMSNDLKLALGDRPNSEFILDPKGEIVVLRDWSRPDTLRADLEKLVGKSKSFTRPSDLDLKIERKKPEYKKGIVKRPQVPRQMRPIQVTPKESKDPFYVKLRAEVESNVQSRGSGKVYLGFHLDPVHQVHWNNLASPIEYEVTGLKSGKLTPQTGKFAKVEVESDIDPREFVIDADKLRPNTTFQVKVRYFACSDTEGWCKPVTQEYEVKLTSDRDAGSARRTGGNRPGGQPGTGPPRNGPAGRFTVERFMSFDKNGDGKVSMDEAPQPMKRMIDRADQNGDSAIDRKEAEMIAERMKRRGGR